MWGYVIVGGVGVRVWGVRVRVWAYVCTIESQKPGLICFYG